MSKPYPWFYAVNDRPVQIVELPGGSTDCLVYDHKTGNFVPDRTYFAYVSPGSGKDVDAFTAEQFAAVVANRRASTVRKMAERMCAAKTTSEQDLLDALAVAVSPAPLGGTSARVRGGDIPTFEVELADGTLTRGDLDARFGEPQKLPRTGPGAAHNLAYAVDVAGASHSCTVFARFASDPESTTPVTSVMWRLDPARPA